MREGTTTKVQPQTAATPTSSRVLIQGCNAVAFRIRGRILTAANYLVGPKDVVLMQR
jgi:hypothetical protein